MYEFEPGETRTAVISFSNRRDVAFSGWAHLYLYLNTFWAVLSQVQFSLNAKETKEISIPVTMTTMLGTFPVKVVVYDDDHPRRVITRQDVDITVGHWITKGFMRNNINPPVSIYYSGWLEFTEFNTIATYLGQIGGRIEAGFCWKNIRSVPVTCSYVMWHNHFVWDVGYRDFPLTPQTQPPTRFGDAPTGLPYSNGQYQCDVFAPPGTLVQPGEVAFIYTEGWYGMFYENKIYLTLIIDGIAVETVYLGAWGF